MRGHWLSGTRKLNKHYQNGGVFTPPPSDWVWKKYTIGGPPIPLRFDHDLTYAAGESGLFYNKPYDSAGDIDDPYGPIYNPVLNLAAGYNWIGPVHRTYGLIEPGFPDYDSYDPNSPNPIEADMMTWYLGQISLHKKPMYDPDYGSTGNRLVNLHKDMGKRYIKYTMPEYSYAPSYFIGNTLTAYDSITDCKIIHSGVRLSAQASKELALLSANRNMGRMLRGRLTWVDDQNTDQNGYLDIHGVTDTGQMYDNEQNGTSYLEGTIYVRESGVTTTYTARVFVFLYDGEYYVDLCAHIYTYNTWTEITPPYDIYVDVLSYPSVLNGYCHAPVYLQPDHSWGGGYPSAMGDYIDVYWPLWNQLYYVHIDGQSNGTYNNLTVGSHTEAIEKINPNLTQNLFFNYTRTQFMTVEDVDPAVFWQAESDWHTIHGGTPYQPLTP